jgi:hypothetical protein
MNPGNSFGTVSWFDLVPRSPSAPAAPVFPSGLSPIAWVDMAQQVGVNGVAQMSLQDNAVPARVYSGGNRVYQTNGKNGLPILLSNSGYYSNIVNFPSIAASAPFLFWAVMQTAGYSGYLWYGSANQQVRFNYGGSTGSFILYSGAIASSDPLTALESTSWAIYLIHRNASNQVRFYYNGLPKFTTPPTLTGGFDLDRGLLGTSPLDANFGEAGILNTDPTQAEINALGNYLASKWAIAWTNI